MSAPKFIWRASLFMLVLFVTVTAFALAVPQ